MAKMYQTNRPYQVKPKEGETVALCRCGHSEDPPFCTGAHKNHPPKEPHVATGEGKTLFVCGCGGSKNLPFCDGTHSSCPEHEDYKNQW